jgi:hypothetical protein
MLAFDLAENRTLTGWVVLLRFTGSPELTNVYDRGSSIALGGPRRGLFRASMQIACNFPILAGCWQGCSFCFPFCRLLAGLCLYEAFLVPFPSVSWRISRFQE